MASPAPASAEIPASVAVPAGIPPAAALYRPTLVREARRTWGLDAPLGAMAGQIHQESRWRTDARSRFASGLAQFTPGTASDMQRVKDLRELCGDPAGCPTDPRWAIRALVRYDLDLWTQMSFAAGDERLAMALVGYNGGASWVRRERLDCLGPGGVESGCDGALWFGNVELRCLRADWACKESREYPRLILFRWRPLYQGWISN